MFKTMLARLHTGSCNRCEPVTGTVLLALIALLRRSIQMYKHACISYSYIHRYVHSCSAKGSGLFGRYGVLRAGGCPNAKNHNFKIRIFEEVGCDDHCTVVVATELPRSLQKFIFVYAENCFEILILFPNSVYIEARFPSRKCPE